MPESLIAQQLDSLRRQRTAPLILELDLTEGMTEEPPTHPVAAVLAMRRTRLAELLDGLHRASRDQRVKALVAKLGGRRIGLATVQEIRRAVEEFRDAGKRTVAWAESFGEFSAGNVPYYLATAFDTIYLQPSGDLGLTGIALEQVFLRGALDHLGVDFQVAKRHEYKSAAEQFTERSFSEPAREATQRLATSITTQLTEAIAERRRIDQSGPPRPATLGSSTSSATGTRCTPRSAGRSARGQSLPPLAVTSARGLSPSVRAACPARNSGMSH
jgi:protease-4